MFMNKIMSMMNMVLLLLQREWLNNKLRFWEEGKRHRLSGSNCWNKKENWKRKATRRTQPTCLLKFFTSKDLKTKSETRLCLRFLNKTSKEQVVNLILLWLPPLILIRLELSKLTSSISNNNITKAHHSQANRFQMLHQSPKFKLRLKCLMITLVFLRLLL